MRRALTCRDRGACWSRRGRWSRARRARQGERAAELAGLDPQQRRRLPPASVDRFCHVFARGELEALAARLPNVQIEDAYYDNANWAVVLRKIAL